MMTDNGKSQVDALAVITQTFADVEARIAELEDELSGVWEQVETLNELKRAHKLLVKVVNPEAAPKRKRRTKTEMEAARQAEATASAS